MVVPCHGGRSDAVQSLSEDPPRADKAGCGRALGQDPVRQELSLQVISTITLRTMQSAAQCSRCHAQSGARDTDTQSRSFRAGVLCFVSNPMSFACRSGARKVNETRMDTRAGCRPRRRPRALKPSAPSCSTSATSRCPKARSFARRDGRRFSGGGASCSAWNTTRMPLLIRRSGARNSRRWMALSSSLMGPWPPNPGCG